MNLLTLFKTLKAILRNNYNFFSAIYLMNLNKWLREEILFVGRPAFNQKTRFTGEGKIQMGINCVFGYRLGGRFHGAGIEFQARYKDSKIIIGNSVSVNNNLYVCSANFIEIGDNTLIGENVTIIDHDAHHIHPDKRLSIGKIGRVVIGKNVWIGNNVSILKNSIIGNNTIIAAGSIVNGVFDSNIIIGGVPSKFIKNIDV